MREGERERGREREKRGKGKRSGRIGRNQEKKCRSCREVEKEHSCSLYVVFSMCLGMVQFKKFEGIGSEKFLQGLTYMSFM